MADLGRVLILLGALAMGCRAGVYSSRPGQHPAGTVARRYCLPGQEQHILFPLATSILVSVVLSVVM